jgi:hypothetical protein
MGRSLPVGLEANEFLLIIPSFFSVFHVDLSVSDAALPDVAGYSPLRNLEVRDYPSMVHTSVPRPDKGLVRGWF